MMIMIEMTVNTATFLSMFNASSSKGVTGEKKQKLILILNRIFYM